MDRRDRRLREEAEKELKVAHDMQMGLLPSASPQIQGVNLSGICIPANHVGGDYYQFLRQGYFCVDSRYSTPDHLVFNRTVSLRDTWGKIEKKGP